MASAMVGGTSRARCDPIVRSDGGQPQAGPKARAHGCASPCVGLGCRAVAASSVFMARQTLLRPRLGLGAVARWALMRSSRALAGSSAGSWGTSSPRPHRRERCGTAAGWAGRPRPRDGARQGLGCLMRWSWLRLGRESNAFTAALGLGRGCALGGDALEQDAGRFVVRVLGHELATTTSPGAMWDSRRLGRQAAPQGWGAPRPWPDNIAGSDIGQPQTGPKARAQGSASQCFG